jgi:quercetin dioxygenase-like cupin family protein
MRAALFFVAASTSITISTIILSPDAYQNILTISFIYNYKIIYIIVVWFNNFKGTNSMSEWVRTSDGSDDYYHPDLPGERPGMVYAEYDRSLEEQTSPAQTVLHVLSTETEQPLSQERFIAPRAVFDLSKIIEDIQASANAPTHEERTRVLVNNRDHVTILSGYQPGEGEDLHAHPTHNTLLFLRGAFDLWIVNTAGEEECYQTYPGMMVALDRGQPHRVQAKADQEGLSIVMVSIIEGMPTSTPGYSVPVQFPPVS